MPRGKTSNFKACLKCKMLVPPDVEVCPNCGSKDFSTDWEGLVVVIDAEKSSIAKLMGIEKPGRYAIRVR